MTSWVITSWVFVAILTGVNIFVFLKLKGASEQMLKMAFPNAKKMNEALGQMQKMMGGMGGKMPNMGGMGGKNANTDAQLKQAMAMLKNIKK
jgi:hypothetical protein